MNLDPTDRSLARKQAEAAAIEALDLFDIEQYIAENPTLVDGWPVDMLDEAADRPVLEGLLDEVAE